MSHILFLFVLNMGCGLSPPHCKNTGEVRGTIPKDDGDERQGFPHYKNMSVQYIGIFSAVKIENLSRIFFLYIFLIFGQNIDCGYTLEPTHQGSSNEVTSSHNIYIGAKVRKIGIPLHNPVLLYKSGV